jgi:hypothetical protein
MFLAMQATQPANAVGATTLNFNSTTAADYSGENALSGDSTIDWAPWASGNALNAPLVTGSANWFGRAGWGTHNYVVQDDGSGTNNALWVQKAITGCTLSGMTVQNAPGITLVSTVNNVVTAKVKSQDASTAVRLRMTNATWDLRTYPQTNTSAIYATATTSATGAAWSTLTFTFSGANAPVPGTIYSKMSFEFDWDGAKSGQGSEDWGCGNYGNSVSKLYMLDDVTFTSSVGCTPAATGTLVTMESNSSAEIALDAFEGATASVEKAPAGGSPGNLNAIRLAKPSGNPWGGAQIINSICTTYGGANKVTANVWAPEAGLPFRLALEGSGAQFTADATTWKAGWQQLAWNISGVTGFRGKVIIFPDFMGAVGASKVFFIDDIAFNGATSPMWGNNLMNIPQSPSSEENKGKYVHVRLQKTFIGSSYDASWWDGIREYRDADTKAYVKYLSARSTFSLTYKVTDANGAPMANTPVELIVNANYSCSKATFTYGAAVIGRDDCGGKGETRLPKKNTDGNGDVTFVLTNTNVKGEAMPSSLSSPPTVGVANEIGSNIQPYVADKQGFDMLLVHFVEPTGSVTLSGAATAAMNVNTKTPVTFNLKDAKGKAIAGVDVKFVADGVGTVGRTATTDGDGNVSTWVNNYSDAPGVQIVSATYVGSNGFAATTSTVIQWSSTKPVATVTGGKGSVTVSIANGAGKTARISVAGSATVSRKLSSNSAVVKVKASAGSKVVTVTIDGVATKVVVQVAK